MQRRENIAKEGGNERRCDRQARRQVNSVQSALQQDPRKVGPTLCELWLEFRFACQCSDKLESREANQLSLLCPFELQANSTGKSNRSSWLALRQNRGYQRTVHCSAKWKTIIEQREKQRDKPDRHKCPCAEGQGQKKGRGWLHATKKEGFALFQENVREIAFAQSWNHLNHI